MWSSTKETQQKLKVTTARFYSVSYQGLSAAASCFQGGEKKNITNPDGVAWPLPVLIEVSL